MKIYLPYRNRPQITQGFSKNLNTYYAEGGLLGHTGIDYWQPHGSEILCGVDGYVFSVLNRDNPDLMRYRAVFTLVEVDGVAYEVSYGHLGEIYVKEGDNVKIGDRIGTQSNTGNVASGGVKITREMKALGSSAGSHLHFQVRLLRKVDKKEKGKKYLFSKVNGSYYEIPLFKNGFNGCIDPSPFMQTTTAFQHKNGFVAQVIENIKPTPIVRTLRYGMRGNDVRELQTKLKIKADGIFGRQTEKAVKDFQKKSKLLVDGIVGRQTRSKLYGKEKNN